MFRRAAILLQDQDDREGEAEALHSLATIARRYGDFTTAFAHLDRVVELSDERSAVRAKCGNSRGGCLLALGNWTEAERELRAALQLAEEQHDEIYACLIIHNLGGPPYMRGDFGEALRWFRRAQRDERNTAPIPQEADTYLNLARCHLYRGEFEMCEQHLDRALERCQLFNIIRVRANVFETYGMLYRELGDVARAREFYERAARDYDKVGIELARCELLDEQALLELQIGNLAAARKLIDQLINARRNLNDELRNQTAALTLGRILIAQGEEESARAELDSALGFFRQNGLYYYEAQSCIALAQCDGAAGRDVQMLERLRRALDLAARYDYEYWLRRELTAHPRLFAMPEVAELLPPDARAHLASQVAIREPSTAPSVQEAPSVPLADLTINLLGHVEIFRDPKRQFAPTPGRPGGRTTSFVSSPPGDTAAPRKIRSLILSGARLISTSLQRIFTLRCLTSARRSTAINRLNRTSFSIVTAIICSIRISRTRLTLRSSTAWWPKATRLAAPGSRIVASLATRPQ
jgi:tetratricopeptide (TPR) repeat protein